MRLAVISDIHLEFRVPPPPVPPAEVYVIAGDLHPDPEVRLAFLRSLPGEVLFVPGNHDFYGHDFPVPDEGLFVRDIDGVRFAGATLWTGFPRRYWPDFEYGMTDARVIRGISYRRLREAHETHLTFLQQARADVIITHHAPTFKAVQDHLPSAIYHPFYASPILDRQGHPFTRTRLWIHGHVHAQQTLRVNGVEVICHAHGYPMERHLKKRFRLLDLYQLA